MNYVHDLQRAGMYRFKRSYGFPIDLYKLVSSVADPRTGKIVVTTRMFHVPKAVVLAGAQSRKQLARKMAAGTEAARDFAASGSYDTNLLDFIIDRKDVPRDLELTSDDWIIHDNRKYQVVKFGGVEKESWTVTARELVGEIPIQTPALKAEDSLGLSEASNV